MLLSPAVYSHHALHLLLLQAKVPQTAAQVLLLLRQLSPAPHQQLHDEVSLRHHLGLCWNPELV